MKTIVNKTRRPLKIKLAQGRVLRLGPAKEGQIATHDVERESVQKMIEAGEVDVFDDVSRSGLRAPQRARGALGGSQGVTGRAPRVLGAEARRPVASGLFHVHPRFRSGSASEALPRTPGVFSP